MDDKSPAETSRASGSDLVIGFSGFCLGVSGNLTSPNPYPRLARSRQPEVCPRCPSAVHDKVDTILAFVYRIETEV